MKIIQKVAFYLLSMMMLFVIVGFLCMDIPIIIGGKFIGFSQLWDNCKLGVLIIFISLIIECIVYSFLKKSWRRNSPELSVKIIKIDNLNYSLMTFIASYFLPLVSFDYLKFNHWIVLLLLLIVIGIIFCNSNGFYKNPTLAILGFRLYKVRAETQKVTKANKIESIIIISNIKLNTEDCINYVMLSEGVGVVFKTNYYDKRRIN